MNEKLTIRQLSDQLSSEIFGRDAERRTALVGEIFALISDTLAEGESVSLKGFGEFRPSTDNSGMVEFTPDAAFEATANAPFASYTPVELAPEYTDELLEPEPEEESAPEPEAESALEDVGSLSPIFESDSEPPVEEDMAEYSGEGAHGSCVQMDTIDCRKDSGRTNSVSLQPSESSVTPSEQEPKPMSEPKPVPAHASMPEPEPETEAEAATDSRFGSGFFWGLLTGLVIGALLFLIYVMLTADVAPADTEYVLDEETASAAFGVME